MRPEPLTTPQRHDAVGLSAGEKLLALVLAVTAAAGVFAWVVGQLAGLLFAHTWLHVGVADMPEVLWHLPKHPGNPALAWPARFGPELPGSVGMYFCAALVVGVLVAVVGLVTRYWPGHHGVRSGVPVLPDRNRHRAATWASGWELRRLVVRRPKPGRVILGRTRGVASRLLAAEDCHSVFVFGPAVIFSRAEARPVDQQRCVVDGVLDAAWEGYVEGWSGDAGVIELMPSFRGKEADGPPRSIEIGLRHVVNCARRRRRRRRGAERRRHYWMPVRRRASCRSRQARRATIRPSRTVNTS